MTLQEKTQLITEKIQEIIKSGFTGSITVEYHFLESRMMNVNLSTQEKIEDLTDKTQNDKMVVLRLKTK